MTNTILYPLGDNIGFVQLVQHVGDDKMIVNAARVSFGQDNTLPLDGRDEKLIRYLLTHHHGSPFEHNLITFRLKCPIFVDRQLVRHRVGTSKNEVSGRYTEVKDEFYAPQDFRIQSVNNRQASVQDDGSLPQGEARVLYLEACEAALEVYRRLLAIGVTREQARGVLPQTMYTTSYYTFNLRSLLHLLELRTHAGAQYETQRYALAMQALVEPLFPVTVREWLSTRESR